MAIRVQRPLIALRHETDEAGVAKTAARVPAQSEADRGTVTKIQ